MSILAELAKAPRELEEALQLLPTEALAWRPESWQGAPGERFSAIGHICHVRDIELDGYHVRFTRLLEEDMPDLVSIDGYALERDRGYDRQEPVAALIAFRAARERTLRLLVENWERKARRGTFAEYGEVTFESLAHILRSHDLQHLAGLQWLEAMRKAGA
jgi:hypothetical protein